MQVKEGRTTYTYNALNQLVTEKSSEGSITYTYDANGNLVKQSGSKNVDYSYDKENHLLRATIQQGNSVTVESYTYDYAGNRLSKTVNESDTVCYVNDTSGSLTQVVAETDQNGKETAFYTRSDELLSMERNGSVWYYIYDGHGNTRLLTNAVGTVTDRYDYDACGNLLQKEGETENDFLYTGEQYNANTGLYYLRARYMDPSTGTFISMDSYQGSLYDPVSLHKYLYANANPVKYTDPTGYYSLVDMSVGMAGTSILAGSVYLMYRNLVKNFINQSEALRSVYSVSYISTDVILGIGSSNVSEGNGAADVATKLLQRSLNTYVYAYISMGMANARAVSDSMKVAQIYVESISKEIEKEDQFSGESVYLLRERKDPYKVRYVGRTNDPRRRENEHKRDDRKQTNGIAWKMWVVATGLTKEVAKALEQSLICIYTIDALANARYEIAEKNYEKFAYEIERAAEIARIPLPDLQNAMKR